MSCFIWFYIIAPIIFKFVKSLKGAIVFWLMSFVISLIWKICIYAIFSNIAGLHSLDVLTGTSPFGVLYQFAIGILVYYFLKEKKPFEGIIVLSLISICGLILNRNIFIWCSLCGLAVIAFENMNIILPSRLQNYIKIVGKESFHIYLSHLLSFAISERVTWIKQQIRFTDKTMEELSVELHIEPTYLSCMFKKVEGVSPSQFRKSWCRKG